MVMTWEVFDQPSRTPLSRNAVRFAQRSFRHDLPAEVSPA